MTLSDYELRNRRAFINSGRDSDFEGFKGLRKEQKYMGTSDYTMKRAIVFRENYLKVMEKYSHFDNYEKLMKKLRSFTNPISFFNFVSQNELTR